MGYEYIKKMGAHRFCGAGFRLFVCIMFIVVAMSPAGHLYPAESKGGLRFSVTFPHTLSAEPLAGRLLVFLSTDGSKEPREQIYEEYYSQQVFGLDVEGWKPGEAVVVDGSAFGFPLNSLGDVPSGTYYVQGLLHKYETFERADGHRVKLPMDRGEGQEWSKAPGNPYSTPMQMDLDGGTDKIIALSLDCVIPEIPRPQDTTYIKHVDIKSDVLSKFWGRPMFIGANVLLPHGFDQHPEARYPLIISHGHFNRTFAGFRETPPDPDLTPHEDKRFKEKGYNRIKQEYAHQFYKEWTGKDFPRMVIIEIRHANPYGDASYAVNSANFGPYGDAIVNELIPHIEKTFRCIGEGWARFLYGGSTCGWQSLAAQVFYPDFFNGCFAACPDPVDFRAYTLVNIYKDTNAYYVKGPWAKIKRPGMRDYLGNVYFTMEDSNYMELALGARSRSGGQWDIWDAAFGPVDKDGYPKPLWDKRTGDIDASVAAYWKEHYDLSHILKRDWATLGPKLEGKLHIYCGDMDSFYLNNAVYLLEDFLKSAKAPHYNGEVDYGDRAEHCWNGDHKRPNSISRLRYHQMYVPKILERMKKTAPENADLTSWRY